MTMEMEIMRQNMENQLNDEWKLRSDIEKKLYELHSHSSDDNINSNSDDIEVLENTHQEIDRTYMMMEIYKEILSEFTINIINLWTNDQFLASSNMTYIQYYQFK